MRSSLSDKELRKAGCVTTLANWTELSIALIDTVLCSEKPSTPPRSLQ